MKIASVRVSFSKLHSLGDYSNCKPMVEIEADIDCDGDIGGVIDGLVRDCVSTVHEIIDSELMQHDRKPFYNMVTTWHVYRSDLRECFVVLPSPMKPKTFENWQVRTDDWIRPYPRKLFPSSLSANSYVMELQEGNGMHYKVLTLNGTEQTPPLPDMGEPPNWYKKDLKTYFNYLDIPQERLGRDR